MAGWLPEHVARPDFAVSVRGYDRSQVDAYFGRLLEWLADAENRAASAARAREAMAQEVGELRAALAALREQAGAPALQSMSTFGERMGEVVQSAVQAAEELRAAAEREARERRETAIGEAERMLASARAEADRVVADAVAAKGALEGRVADLRAAHGQALEELAALRDRISALGGLPDPVGRADPEPGGHAEGQAGTARDAPTTGFEPTDPPAHGVAGTTTTAVLPALTADVGARDPLDGLRRLSSEGAGRMACPVDDEDDEDEEEGIVAVVPAPREEGETPPLVTATPTTVLPKSARRAR